MNLTITLLEDNKQDYLLLSESINQWANDSGHLIHITWINSHSLSLKSSQARCDFLSKLSCSVSGFFTPVRGTCSI